MEFTPGWCIGWFFVPVANLWRPYQAVKELFRASVSGAESGGWQNHSVTPLVGLWWALWLVAITLNRVAFYYAKKADTVKELMAATRWDIYGSIAALPLCVVALMMMWRLYSLQEQMKHRAAMMPSSLGDGMSCQNCGEPVTVMIGDCPMCGEMLAASS